MPSLPSRRPTPVPPYILYTQRAFLDLNLFSRLLLCILNHIWTVPRYIHDATHLLTLLTLLTLYINLRYSPYSPYSPYINLHKLQYVCVYVCVYIYI
jgi:hypothetical protein